MTDVIITGSDDSEVNTSLEEMVSLIQASDIRPGADSVVMVDLNTKRVVLRGRVDILDYCTGKSKWEAVADHIAIPSKEGFHVIGFDRGGYATVFTYTTVSRVEGSA